MDKLKDKYGVTFIKQTVEQIPGETEKQTRQPHTKEAEE